MSQTHCPWWCLCSMRRRKSWCSWWRFCRPAEPHRRPRDAGWSWPGSWGWSGTEGWLERKLTWVSSLFLPNWWMIYYTFWKFSECNENHSDNLTQIEKNSNARLKNFRGILLEILNKKQRIGWNWAKMSSKSGIFGFSVKTECWFLLQVINLDHLQNLFQIINNIKFHYQKPQLINYHPNECKSR